MITKTIDELLTNPSYRRSIASLELSVPTENWLKNDDILYVGELAMKSESELLKTPNFKRKHLQEIREILPSLSPEVSLNTSISDIKIDPAQLKRLLRKAYSSADNAQSELGDAVELVIRVPVAEFTSSLLDSVKGSEDVIDRALGAEIKKIYASAGELVTGGPMPEAVKSRVLTALLLANSKA